MLILHLSLTISRIQLAAMHTAISQQLSQTVGIASIASIMKNLADVKKHEKIKTALKPLAQARKVIAILLRCGGSLTKPLKI